MFTKEEKEYYNLIHVLKSHQNKVNKAKEIITKALEITPRFSINCSYGKDSLVLLDLVFSITNKCIVIQSDSGYQLPETYEVRKKCEEKYGYKTIIMPQLMPMEEFLKEFGLPGINRTATQHKKVVEITKKNRLDDFIKDHGAEGVFWGIRKEESKGRRVMASYKGDIFYNKNRELYFASPISNFKADDIWSYISWHKLDYPSFYDKQNCGQNRNWIRNSSWVTTDGATTGTLVWLKYNYPQYYNKLKKEFKEIEGYV